MVLATVISLELLLPNLTGTGEKKTTKGGVRYGLFSGGAWKQDSGHVLRRFNRTNCLPRLKFDEAKNEWLVTLKKGSRKFTGARKKTDADKCMDGGYCEDFGREGKEIIKKS